MVWRTGEEKGARSRAGIVLLIYLIGIFFLPLAGVFLKGESPVEYLTFPPAVKRSYTPGPSSLFTSIVSVFGALILGAAVLVYLREVRGNTGAGKKKFSTGKFPAWGVAAAVYTTVIWFLAWNRFGWFKTLQPHTFPLLWLGYILVINALCVWRKGKSLMTSDPGFFLFLFPVSALFWWTFEFLNRFSQNWYYTGYVPGTAFSYIFFASISFSTVLPAVFGTWEFLMSFASSEDGHADRANVKPLVFPGRPPVLLSVFTLAVSAFSLIGISMFPDYLYPLLWISPGMLILSLKWLLGGEELRRRLSSTGRVTVAAFALSALLCGFFWEMWNYKSLAKWKYTIPFVKTVKLFEMPLPGYFGYLPFGIECMLFIMLAEGVVRRRKR